MLIFSITKFRSLTELPKSPTPEAIRLTDDLISSMSLPTGIKDFYELFLDLVDVRFGAQGLEFALEGLQHLIKAVCQELQFEFTSVVSDAFISFSSAVRSQSLSPNFSGKPFSHANSIIFLLSHRRAQIMSEKDGDERWNKLCLIGYLVSRRAVDSSLNTQYELWQNISLTDSAAKQDFIGINDGQIQESTRAIIKVLMFVDLSKLTEEIPLLIEEDIVEKAMERANSGTKKFDSMYEYYLKWAKLLFSGNPYKRSRIKLVEEKSDKSNKEEKSSFNKLQKYEQSVSEIYQKDIKERQKTSSFVEEERERLLWVEEDDEEIKDGFSPDELSAPPSLSEQWSLRAGLAEHARRLRPLGWTPDWDKSFLTQETLGLTIAYLHDQAIGNKESRIHLELLTFVVTQVFFGFSGDFLIAARFSKGSAPLPSLKNPLIYADGFFYIHPLKYDGKPLFGAVDSRHAKFCLQSSHSFRIPVPIVLKNLFEKKLSSAAAKSGYLFSNLDKDGQDAPFELKKLNKLLAPIRSLTNEKIDLNKIGRSAAINLITKGGLDDLIGAFIRGAVPQHLGAQGHYLNISGEEFSKVHAGACDLIWKRLKVKSESAVAEFNLPSLSEFEKFVGLSEKGFSQTIFNNEIVMRSNAKLLLRFGSPFVPQITLLRDYLKELKFLANTVSSPILRFNIFTSYTALSIMHLAGLRSIEIERLSLDDFDIANKNDAKLIIKGKSNRYYIEWRISYLAASFGSIIADYQAKADVFIEFLRDEIGVYPAAIRQQRNNALFFFAEENGNITPLKTRACKKKIETEIPSKTNTPPYLWKINAPRQLFATTAYNLNVPRRLIDALLGHSSRGREPLARFSGLFFNDIKTAADTVANEIAALLDFSFQEK